MEKGKNEFLRLLCNLYLVALLVALPLYTGQGYWQLGDTKYVLFRNITLLCLGGWLVVGMPDRFRLAAGALRGRKGAKTPESARVSGLDLAVGAYGICALVSAALSSYGRLAWDGYEGWFMGALSQLLFVGIYFFVSRQYDGASWPVYLGEAALFLVTALGLLHRLGIDPLGLMEGWNNRDWEYSHMLSTLGNINWLCGYYSVALAFLTAHYVLEKRFWLRILLYGIQVGAFVLLGIQGSQGGLLILAVCLGISLWLGRGQRAVLKRIWLALAGFFAGMPLMWYLMRLRGEKAAIVADGNVFEHAGWYVWVTGAAASLGIFLLFLWQDRKSVQQDRKAVRDNKTLQESKRRRRGCLIPAAIAAGCAAAGIGLAGYLLTHPIEDGFGSGRGFLWRIASESFAQADWKDKLLGAGPDCYGEAVFNRLGVGTEVWKNEHWDGAVFTNAHNEFLNQLCNVGILGTVSYLAIFIAGLYGAAELKRKARDMGGVRCESVLRGRDGYEEKLFHGGNNNMREEDGEADGNAHIQRRVYVCWLGTLALAMYGLHSFVSFQQVLSTPLLFAVLGICEAERRREKRKNMAPEM